MFFELIFSYFRDQHNTMNRLICYFFHSKLFQTCSLNESCFCCCKAHINTIFTVILSTSVASHIPILFIQLCQGNPSPVCMLASNKNYPHFNVMMTFSFSMPSYLFSLEKVSDHDSSVLSFYGCPQSNYWSDTRNDIQSNLAGFIICG